MKNFKINRNFDYGVYSLKKIFSGLENCKILWKFYGGRKKFLKVIDKEKIRVSKKTWIIWVSDKTGKIIINKNYLRKTPKKILYLDVVHELVHVKQFLDNRKLFSKKFSYVDDPIEIEAYRVTVEEARKISMSEKEIEDYLKVEWVDESEHQKLIAAVMK